MANIYEEANQLAALFGGRSAALTAASRAANKMGGVSGKLVKGLPNFTSSSGRLKTGGTATDLDGGLRPSVFGIPSGSVTPNPGGGIRTQLVRKSKYARYILKTDLGGMNAILDEILKTAQRLSQGDLSYARLASMNNPYGRGRMAPSGRKRAPIGRLQRTIHPVKLRKGVSNLAIINKHTGKLANNWRIKLVMRKTMVKVVLTNKTSYAKYLALGTRKMQAHGPFTTAVAKHIPELNKEWLKVARAGRARAAAAGMM